MQIGDVFQHALVSLGVGAIVAGLRALAPRPASLETTRTLEDLQREYGKWMNLTLLLGVFLVVAFLYPVWKLLLTFGSGGFFDEGTEIGLRVSRICWIAPALPLAWLLANAVMDPLMQKLLGERYPEYLDYADLRFDMDGKAVEKGASIALIALSLLLTFALARWYVIATPDKLRVSTPLALAERVIPIRDVTAIETAPAYIAGNGERTERRTFDVVFADGTRFQPRFDFSEASDAELRRFLEVLAARSGLPLMERALFE